MERKNQVVGRNGLLEAPYLSTKRKTQKIRVLVKNYRSKSRINMETSFKKKLKHLIQCWFFKCIFLRGYLSLSYCIMYLCFIFFECTHVYFYINFILTTYIICLQLRWHSLFKIHNCCSFMFDICQHPTHFL